MNNIARLTKQGILNQPVPIAELLDGSLYYPASAFDGGVVKHFSKKINSFIYCDYATGKAALLEELNKGFKGYELLASRDLRMSELIPSGWQMELPPGFDMSDYYRHKSVIKDPFAHWAVYERLPEYDEDHGAKQFSIIYIGGEGVATSQALYWTNNKHPKALAIIQPGTGFGFNWTDFREGDGPLAWVVLQNKSGIPEFIVSDYFEPGWEEYAYMLKYDSRRDVAIYERKKLDN
ncbi:hypothetical protein [Robiginitalea aurantiaca]|uniref:Uncharacterized protein n=1 Tax=Robiginitalea aurantiaca TaxID=3056915 RepID=A0ABT7WBG2_9FLAO|nr:hypothetical protein [Robiginitalea aurantiaca]MDM9630252.1 hypothetical protein [Robiginitalea aurantiaca]